MLHYLGQGYRWAPDTIFKLTDSQLSMLTYEAWVSNKRNEIKRRFESTCMSCQEEKVRDNLCDNCGMYQPGRIFGNDEYQGFRFRDIVEFPSGKIWEGDQEESALEKMKKADPQLYLAYSQQAMSQGINPNSQKINQMARNNGLFDKKR